MGFSRHLKNKIESLSNEEKDRMIRMGWEDRCCFEAIQHQFGWDGITKGWK